jgi:hemolysin activation/secretion protein
MLRIGGRFMLKGERSRTRVEPEFSQGLNILGARSSDLTSRGASNVFSKVKLTVEHKIALVSDISLGMEATALYGFEKLTPQEELVLGGIDSVRGYPYGDYYADRGILANVELLVPPSFLPDDIKLPYAQNPLKKDVVGVLFFDYGFGYRRGGRDGEKTSDVMASVGTGLRIQLFNQAYLRLEWGVPLKFADDPISESATVRLHMTFNFEDRFHREFDRINKLIKEKTAPIPVAR